MAQQNQEQFSEMEKHNIALEKFFNSAADDNLCPASSTCATYAPSISTQIHYCHPSPSTTPIPYGPFPSPSTTPIPYGPFPCPCPSMNDHQHPSPRIRRESPPPPPPRIRRESPPPSPPTFAASHPDKVK